MSLDTYAGLKQSIADHLDDDLVAYIDDFIDVAEARHKRDIRIREMLTSTDLTLSEDSRTVALPDDFLDFSYLRVQVPDANLGHRYFPDIQEVSTHELTSLSRAGSCRPYRFAVEDAIVFDAIADQDYTVEFFYYTELTALSDSNDSNALLARAPDTYLYAALSASAPFLMNDERVQLWETLYKNARDGLNLSSRGSRRGGPLFSRPAGVTP